MQNKYKHLAAFGGKRSVPENLITPWPAPDVTHIEALTNVIKSGKYHRVNHPIIEQSENMLVELLNGLQTKATGSGTASLHIAFDYFKKQKGKVISPALNWPGAVAPITFANMEPYFVDVSLQNGCIADETLKNADLSKTTGILATHLFGNVCKINQLRDGLLGNQQNEMFLVDDCAQAIGIAPQLATFSQHYPFHAITISGNGSKHLGAGEIGYLSSHNENILNHVDRVSLSSYYKDGQRIYSSQTDGFNYRPNVFSAAIVTARMPTLKLQLEGRRKNIEYFLNKTQNLHGLIGLFDKNERNNSFYMLPLRIDFKILDLPPLASIRDKIVFLLQKEGVPAGVWVTKPVWDFLPRISKQWKLDDFPNTKCLLESMFHISEIALPNDSKTMDYYVKAFTKVWGVIPYIKDWLLEKN